MKKLSKQKVLLLGGTSETAPLALELARNGYKIMVSTATDVPLTVGVHLAISRRTGRLSFEQMTKLIESEQFTVLVDAAHPYAREVHENAYRVCKETGCRYVRYQRRETPVQDESWIVAESHGEAALMACSAGKPILLTIGSRYLLPYVAQAKKHGVPIYARMLNHPESVLACDTAGLKMSGRIFARGPFSYEDNLKLIRTYRIGVVVTKESGEAGGVIEKWRAAQEEGCQFVVIKRPQELLEQSFHCINSLLKSLEAN